LGRTFFGVSVALSADGNTALIGGPYDDNGTGAAWVFTRKDGVWTQQGDKLVGSGGAPGPLGALQGASVALSADGNTAAIGGPHDYTSVGSFVGALVGAVWTFTRNGDTWSQQGDKLVTNDPTVGSGLGTSLALSADGTTVLIGGAFDNNYFGAAWVFTRNGGSWTQQGSKLVGSDAQGPGVFQGGAVALSTDGNTALVGGDLDNNCLGAAWVFTRSGATWTQQGSKLVANNSAGFLPNSCFFFIGGQGAAVALAGDGNTAVIGAPGACDQDCAGAAFVFRRTGGAWTQQNKLVGDGGVNPALDCDFCGLQLGSAIAVSADGSTVFAGGPADADQGAAWAYALPHFTFEAPAIQQNAAPFTFQVSALDANGLLLPAYAGTLHFTSSDPAAVLPDDTTLSSGLGSFFATLKTAGSQTLTATDTSNSGIFGSTGISVAGSNGAAPAARKQ
jgi:hypothetical protein